MSPTPSIEPSGPAAGQRELDERLSMLASSIAGVPLRVSPTPDDSLSWCDGAELSLQASLAPDVRRLVAVSHALLVAAGTLRVYGLGKLIGRPGIAQRYLALELRRALSTLGERLPHRLEQQLAATCACDVSASPTESLAWALDRRRDISALPSHFGTLRPVKLAWARARGSEPAAAPGSTSELTRHHDDDELDHGAQKLLRVFSSPLGGGPVGDLFLKLLGFGRSPGKSEGDLSGGAGDAVSGDALTTGPAQRGLEQRATPYRQSKLGTPEHPRGFSYPEWDQDARRYRAGHVSVHEFAPHPVAGATRERARIPKRSLRAQLARVGVEIERHRGQLEGEELDLDRLVRFATDPDRQAEGARLYLASRRTRRDLTLLVLLDISQSTADKSDSGQSIFGQQRELSREIVKAAARMGDRVALYGYHSRGRHHVHCLRLKGFGEPFGARAEQRLDALEPGGLSRLGAAVRHATHRLQGETQHSHRLLLLLSDGFAYDDGYERSYAEADTQKALREAQHLGIACVCLNVGTNQDDETLQRLYGSSAYLRCSDVSKAVPALRKLIRSAMIE